MKSRRLLCILESGHYLLCVFFISHSINLLSGQEIGTIHSFKLLYVLDYNYDYTLKSQKVKY